jgi:hypothetical protein
VRREPYNIKPHYGVGIKKEIAPKAEIYKNSEVVPIS